MLEVKPLCETRMMYSYVKVWVGRGLCVMSLSRGLCGFGEKQYLLVEDVFVLGGYVISHGVLTSLQHIMQKLLPPMPIAWTLAPSYK